MMTQTAKDMGRQFLGNMTIVASNDINEESLHSLADQVGRRTLSFFRRLFPCARIESHFLMHLSLSRVVRVYFFVPF